MFIYKITNILDGMEYIGMTKRDPNKRFREHTKKRYSKHSLLTRSIIKYGANNFKMEILEEVKNFDELEEREKFYISHFNTMFPNGFNLHIGGCFPKSKQKIKIRPTDECLRLARIARTGSKHTKETLEKISKKRKGIAVYHKPILAIDKNNNVYNFKSINEASFTLGIKRRSISSVLNGWSKTAKGFKFEYIVERG